MEIGGRAAARSDRAFQRQGQPRIMMQPSYTLPTMRDKEVAVPMSTMTMGAWIFGDRRHRRGHDVTAQLVVDLGLDFKPVLMPGPTTMGGMPVRRAMASVKDGSQRRNDAGEDGPVYRARIRPIELKDAQELDGALIPVLLREVSSRARNNNSPVPLNRPTVVLELPTSTARIITYPPPPQIFLLL